ncbi:MAG TPA: hypothetical protein VK699_20745 [Terriglobales bacterium]|jgi:hypothetical protein|nr:hypothetical protein [Terriglobales bacterium]
MKVRSASACETSAFLPALCGLIFVLLAMWMPARIIAQDNYEIQVYGADTVEPGSTMVELHSNFTVSGSKVVTDGVAPTNHAEHETIEITQGINSWFETGFYIFTSARSGDGWDWVGDHIRPRFRAPDSWHWPVGVSVSNEVGYQRRKFSVDTWSWEIRPIIDKKIGPWYLAFNPTFDRALHGPDVSRGFEFSPNAKVSFDINPKVALGMEYYGALGPVDSFDRLHDQQQQFFPSIDLNVSPDWEINFGVGVGVTHGTDHLIIKGILGRRFSFHHKTGRVKTGTY